MVFQIVLRKTEGTRLSFSSFVEHSITHAAPPRQLRRRAISLRRAPVSLSVQPYPGGLDAQFLRLRPELLALAVGPVLRALVGPPGVQVTRLDLRHLVRSEPVGLLPLVQHLAVPNRIKAQVALLAPRPPLAGLEYPQF